MGSSSCGRLQAVGRISLAFRHCIRLCCGLHSLTMTESSPPPKSVRRNLEEHRHEIEVDGQLCVVDHPVEDGTAHFTHTYVPPSLRGRGLAELLVRTALEWARMEGLRVEPSCSYVAAYLKRHAEFSDLLPPK